MDEIQFPELLWQSINQSAYFAPKFVNGVTGSFISSLFNVSVTQFHSSHQGVPVAFRFELMVVVCKEDLSEANILTSRALWLPQVVYVFKKVDVVKLLKPSKEPSACSQHPEVPILNKMDRDEQQAWRTVH